MALTYGNRLYFVQDDLEEFRGYLEIDLGVSRFHVRKSALSANRPEASGHSSMTKILDQAYTKDSNQQEK